MKRRRKRWGWRHSFIWVGNGINRIVRWETTCLCVCVCVQARMCLCVHTRVNRLFYWVTRLPLKSRLENLKNLHTKDLAILPESRSAPLRCRRLLQWFSLLGNPEALHWQKHSGFLLIKRELTHAHWIGIL